MVRNIKEKNLISIPEVKEIMDEFMKTVGSNENFKLDAFQEATLEYVNRFSKMSAKAARKIIKLLVDEYKMEPALAIQVVNIDPQYIEELKVIFEKDAKFKALPNDKLTEIIQLIKEEQV
jgi:DNA-directed RNA polymerase subunit F